MMDFLLISSPPPPPPPRKKRRKKWIFFRGADFKGGGIQTNSDQEKSCEHVHLLEVTSPLGSSQFTSSIVGMFYSYFLMKYLFSIFYIIKLEKIAICFGWSA